MNISNVWQTLCPITPGVDGRVLTTERLELRSVQSNETIDRMRIDAGAPLNRHYSSHKMRSQRVMDVYEVTCWYVLALIPAVRSELEQRSGEFGAALPHPASAYAIVALSNQVMLLL